MFHRDEREIARARRMVRGALRSWGMEADIPVLELLVSELVSNALLHGTGTILVRVSSDGLRVRLEVADEGSSESSPQLIQTGVLGGGWGLRFVEQLTESWGMRDEGGGTLVWAVTPSVRAEDGYIRQSG